MSIKQTGALCVLAATGMLLGAFSGLSHADNSELSSTPAVERQGDLWIAQGDIIVAKATTLRHAGQKTQPANQVRGLSVSNELSLWPNGLVPYQFSDDLSDETRQVIETAIAHWNSESSIELVDRTGTSVLSQQAANSPDFLNFSAGASCASWVGRIGGMQEIWVSDYCAAGSIIHEIGHAVGLLHEHTRADRDQYLSVQWDNIQQDKGFNFEIMSDGAMDIRAYDYNSIMHYGEYYFSNNGSPTLVPLDHDAARGMGQRIALSDGDLTTVRELYDVDLSLTPSIAFNENAPELTLTVTNLSESGATGVLLALDNNATVAGFVTQDAWSCSQTDTHINCRLPVLQGQATSTITLAFEDTVGLSALNPVLSSKNFDTNQSNNTVNEPDVAAALSASASGGATGNDVASGNAVAPTLTVGDVVGGSLDLLFALSLVLLTVMRRAMGVIASPSRFNDLVQHAHSVTSASPRRTCR